MRKIILLILIFVFGVFAIDLSQYLSKSTLSINNSSSSILHNYQVKIILDSTNFNFANAKSDGSDIVITNSQNRLLPYHIDSYDSANKYSIIWVRVDSLVIGSSNSIFVLYNNPSPQTFDIPPIGPFVKSTSNPIAATTSGSGFLPENINYDSATNKYWVVFEDRRGAAPFVIGIASTVHLDSAWAIYGSPISSPGAGSGKNHNPVNAPHLLRYNGKWLLFRGDQIYLDTSSVITGPYGPYSSSPIVESPTTTGLWNSYRVTEPYVFYDSLTLNKWVMVLMGDKYVTIETVGYYTADSPYGPWTEYPNNPIMNFGSKFTYDMGCVADPHVYRVDSTYYITYVGGLSGTTFNSSYYYTTKDWVNFTKGNIVLNTGNKYGWDHLTAFRGATFKLGNYYYLHYAGRGDIERYQIGAAKQYAKSTVNGYPIQQVFGVRDSFTTATLNNYVVHQYSKGTNGSYTISDNTLKLNSGKYTEVRPYSQVLTGYEVTIGDIIEAKIQFKNIDSIGTRGGGIGFGRDSFGLSNKTVFTNGKFNSALSFTGNTGYGYFTAYNPQKLRQQTNITVEAWINVSRYSHQTLSYFLSKHNGWAFGLWNDGYLTAVFNGVTVIKATNGAFTASDTGSWVHVAFTYDGTSVSLFKNGTKLTTTGSFASNIDTTASLYIGCRNDRRWYFDGAIDEVRISDNIRYSTNFTPETSEFASDANTRALWHLNSQTSGTTYDSSGNGCNAKFITYTGANIHFYRNKNLILSSSDTASQSETVTDIIADTLMHDYKIWWKSSSEVAFRVDSSDWLIQNSSLPEGSYPVLIKTDAVNDNVTTSNLWVDNLTVRRYVYPEPIISNIVTPNPHIDTLKLVCSAENALTYQWYQNDTVKVGATDSVLVIYADSLFYSKKQVFYCLVNGSVKSGEWRFQASTSRTSRWNSYKLFYKQAYKNTWK